jgi:hypothetical protein
MSLVDKAFKNLGDLRLWYNDQAGTEPTLADMQEIIPLRWAYFRDNWEFIVGQLQSKISTYAYPDLLDIQINNLSEVIRIQRHDANKRVNPFSKSNTLNKYYAVWENLPLSGIPLTKEENTIASDKIARIRRFIKTDFLNIRKSLEDGRDEIADTVGLSDADYNATFHRSSVPQLRSARIKDVIDMQTFQQAIVSVDYILSNTASLNTTNVDPFALARANANNPDINIVTGLSGQLVRMYYGDSLQAIAARYLGDADRWIEIAIANGLRPPYIDEIGQAIPLISNGGGSQINIAKLDNLGTSNIDKIYVNQIIFLQSNTIKFPDQRAILSIKEIPISGELVIELSGTPNLNDYQTTDGAYIRVFKPNTINSNFLIMLPQPEAVQQSSTKEVPFFLASKSEDEKRAGVDLLLNTTNDLSFTASGDFQLSYGLANAMQAMQIKMMSEKGTSSRHPNFGLPSVIGVKAGNIGSIKETLVTGINDLVNADSRFSRIEVLDISVSQGSAIISLVVRLAGSGSLLPISFTVNIN